MNNPQQGSILVVDDDKGIREALSELLKEEGYHVVGADNGFSAMQALNNGQDNFDLVVSDVQMSGMDGMQLMKSVAAMLEPVPVVLMTAFPTIDLAVEAMKYGAIDYLPKPVDAEELIEIVGKRVKTKAAGDFVFGDPTMHKLMELSKRVAKADTTVMIAGESGSGKEVMARSIHLNSLRADQAFIAINCAAIPENMLEAMLFGYEKGAFTGALKTTPGKFELAQGGSLLLDEVSEMDLALQAKLLRVIQEREVERLGSKTTIKLDVRIIATTNRDLAKEVREGRFREDLYYRLNVFPLTMPPLRERLGDIEPIAQLLLDKHTPRGHEQLQFDQKAIRRLLAHSWPGNVRELENVVQRALIMTDTSVISTDALRFETNVADFANDLPTRAEAEDEGLLEQGLKSRETKMIVEVLKQCGGSRKDTASRLGISARTLRYKLARMRDAGVELPSAHGAVA